ncbi:MAG: TetR family transcriptional regulator [Candidatus Dormibacteraeota bacterium]|nr:TetR family transcriptional regulator [Candidatus Dormibacteraeota bacterium]MBV9524985.1 TetR family transcriptional regulator [Candidatus Dormibacteraeota bacterium]
MGRPRLAERSPYDRDQVVDAAVKLFTERGYEGTSMADIAAALGVHKSSIYHHIAGKEQLLDDAVKRALNALHGMLAEPDAVSGRAIDRLRYVVRRTVDIMVRQLAEVTVLLRVRGNTPTERWALSRRRDFDRAVQRLVAEAIADGDLRSDIDAALVTRLIFGMSNSVIEWYQPGGRLSGHDVAAAIDAIIFEGFRASASGDQGLQRRG